MDFWRINPDWSGCMMEKITLLSLRAKTFPRILMSLCKRDIGPYKPGSRGSFPGFNIRTIFAFVMDSGKLWLVLAELSTLRDGAR